jgi:hypothetical protein
MATLNIWRAIGNFFTNVLFKPYDWFRDIGKTESWWSANFINIVLFLITASLFIYWFMKLKKFKKEGTEDYSK